VHDDEYFGLRHPERQLRLRRAQDHEVAGKRPCRPDCDAWSIVDRKGKVVVFFASSEFLPPHNDGLLAGLLSDLTHRPYYPRGVAA
jgi:hypothetical protein